MNILFPPTPLQNRYLQQALYRKFSSKHSLYILPVPLFLDIVLPFRSYENKHLILLTSKLLLPLMYNEKQAQGPYFC